MLELVRSYRRTFGQRPSGQGGAAFARSATQRLQSHLHCCGILPSGFHVPRTHVCPQSQAVGVGPGGGATSSSIDARAADTAAAARGDSRSMAAGSADNQTRNAMSQFQSRMCQSPRA